ncbi:MAG: 23S rRNA (uracil(1939)-C(5))-methyltransferase RlmD [Clostridiales bacterium]|nr:23S rRNA (uracil(1939)-C(5))-methyltransferase RlmD [Clostridiales bacterium]
MLEKNQRIELDISGFTAEGFGVGHCGGIAVFVPNTSIGDKILCHIIKAKKTYCIGKAVEILCASPMRVESDCGVFMQCGGCVFRHIGYDSELAVKYERVRETFRRIGHLEPVLRPIIRAEEINGYRNKAQYPVQLVNGELKIGFYAHSSHRVINCRECLLQPPEFSEILAAFERWISASGASVYNELTGKGLLRHIYIRKAFATGEIMAAAVINGESVPLADMLVSELLKTAGVKSIVLNINRRDTNAVLGGRCVTLWGSDYIEDELCGIRVRISPLSFYQVNRAQAQRLYEKAAEYAALSGTETVLDMYCGAGTIGLSLAGRAANVIGAEIVPEAVADARINARINGISNSEFICADASGAALELRQRGIKPEVVIIDPPRKGCEEQVLETLCEMNPGKIIYVSCDPATLARDCEILSRLGYDITECTPVDLFPRTAHVENVALLVKRDENKQ